MHAVSQRQHTVVTGTEGGQATPPFITGTFRPSTGPGLIVARECIEKTTAVRHGYEENQQGLFF